MRNPLPWVGSGSSAAASAQALPPTPVCKEEEKSVEKERLEAAPAEMARSHWELGDSVEPAGEAGKPVEPRSSQSDWPEAVSESAIVAQPWFAC